MKTILKPLIVLALAATPALAADSYYYWDGGDGNWFTPADWFSVDDGSTGFGPGSGPEAVWINNGFSVTADITDGAISPTRVMIASNDLSNPGPVPTGTSVLEVIGQTLGSNTDFRVGYGEGFGASYAGVLNADGNVSLSGEVLPPARVGVVDDDIAGATITGTVDIEGAFSIVPSTGVGNDLYIGQYTNTVVEAAGNAVGHVAIGTGLVDFDDIRVGYHTNTDADATGSATGTLIIESGGIDGWFNDSGPGAASSTLTVGHAVGANTNAYGTADITGNLTDFVFMQIGFGEGDATTSSQGHVTLRSSHASFTGGVAIGENENGPEMIDASLTLNPSLLEADSLSVYDGTMTFHLDGTTRVTAGTVGDPGTYAAADAVEAYLRGVIVADFDFIPTAGSHTFDLIVTDSLTGVESLMDPSDFQVVDLDPGFTIDFFGVVEDGTDIVRLTISGSPTIPEPSSLALLAIGGLVTLKRTRRNAGNR